MDNGTFETVVTAMVKWVIPAYGVVTSSCLYVLGSTPKAYFVLRSVMDTDDPASCCNVFMFGHILVTLASFFLRFLLLLCVSFVGSHKRLHSRLNNKEKAVFPLPYLKQNKFWPTVRRINGALGDRNLICSCPPLTDY